MLSALPVVLVCVGFQPCPAGIAAEAVSPRTSAPAAIATHAVPPLVRRSASRPLAIENLILPRATKASRPSGAPPLRQTSHPSVATRVTAAFAGAVLGTFVGGYLGSQVKLENDGDSPGFTGMLVGMSVGSVAGGTLGWMMTQ